MNLSNYNPDNIENAVEQKHISTGTASTNPQ